MPRVALLDLHAEYRLFRDDVRRAVEEVLESQQFINGPAVGELERSLSGRFGARCGVAVSSGTDALLVSLMALGVGPGDEVIVPTFTFFATAGVVARLGARPVFVDIDPRTFNLDVAQALRAITGKTRAIVAVHLFGQCADLEALREGARGHSIPIVEDAAQAIGAKFSGKAAGLLGDAGCLSFYPTKNLGGFGEGGFVMTDDEDLGERVRQLRHHGESRRYVHERVGGNFRLDTMKAAILLVKLNKLEDFTRRRRENALLYDELLKGSPVATPWVDDRCYHVYHQYSMLGERRDALIAFLGDRGVQTGVYYPIPLHRQPCFQGLGYAEGSLPVSESVARRIVSLPCHPMMSEEDVRYVAASVREFYGGGDRAGQKPGAVTSVH